MRYALYFYLAIFAIIWLHERFLGPVNAVSTGCEMMKCW